MRLPIIALVFVCSTTLCLAVEQGPAPIPLEPTIFATIPFGKGEGKIATFELGQVGEGVPTSFLFAPNGRLYLLVPHSRSILIVDSSGKYERTIKLRTKEGKALPDKAFLTDLAFDRKGNHLILDRSGGWISRFDKKGRALGVFGHNVGAERFFVTEDGNTIVRDSALGVLNFFDEKGAFIGEVRGPYLAPETNSEGTLVRSRIIGDKRAFIWLRKAGTTLPRLFSIITPHYKKGKIYQAETMGFDKKGTLYVLTTETEADGKYVSYIYCLTPAAKVKARYRIEANMERLGELPRFYRLSKDGRVITFRLTPKDYQVLVYDLDS